MDMLSIRGSKVDSIQLGGLGDAAQEILKENSLSNSDCWRTMIECYGGNPLALKLVAKTIQELFGGSVVQFFGTNKEFDIIVPTIFQKLLSEQFERLSTVEKQILSTLAINRQPMNLQRLQERVMPQVSWSKLLSSLTSLKKRSLVEVISEVNPISFTLQPMIMKYLLTEKKDLSNLVIK